MTGETFDARADLYAAGLVLYRMLAGVDAYTATGAERVRMAPPRTAAALARVLDRARVAALVDACMAPDRTQR